MEITIRTPNKHPIVIFYDLKCYHEWLVMKHVLCLCSDMTNRETHLNEEVV